MYTWYFLIIYRILSKTDELLGFFNTFLKMYPESNENVFYYTIQI